MRTCRLAVLAVSLVLVCPSGWARSGESDLPQPSALGAPKELSRQEVRILAQLLGLGQSGENRQIMTTLPYDGHGIGVLRPGARIDYKIRVVRPNPNVDYKILLVRPDANVDYKIRNFYPGGHDAYVVPRVERRRTIVIDPEPDGRDD